MGYVGNQQTEGYSQVPAKQDLTGATGTSLTLSHAVASAEGIDLYINNVRQEPTEAYSVVGTAVTLTGSVVATDDIYVVYNSLALQTTVPPDASVSTAKIIDGSVTSAKLDTNIAIAGDLTVDTSTLKVDSTNNRVGINQASPTTALTVDADGATVATFNRATNDGDVIEVHRDGTKVFAIGTNNSNSYIVFRTEDATDGCGLKSSGGSTGIIVPANGNGDGIDNHIDLGSNGSRWDDIYATNGTIQTSDQNDKQQIAALTDAEITAAKAISQLFKTFKWNSAVEAKGDAARTHAGVIAQDVETAMTAAGLDAGDYAFFISGTWYADANGNEVEADADGAIEKNRKGIRYPELLAFIGAATEQRLADIETRLAALEAN